jgi:hypothetical protein
MHAVVKAAEIEPPPGFSQSEDAAGDVRSVEETEREKLRRASGSAPVVGVHE